jgi:hypothetical protein
MRLFMMTLAIGVTALPVVAQRGQERSLSCNDRNNNSRYASHCEMREQNVGFAGRLTIDGGTNGGVSIKGWDQGGVLVRARVEASGEDEATARAMVAQVRGFVGGTGERYGSGAVARAWMVGEL